VVDSAIALRRIPQPIAATPSGGSGGGGGLVIRAFEADAAADGGVETAELLERSLSYDTFDTLLQLFTTIATLGRREDRMLQETRIEKLDTDTAKSLRGWGAL
jgi:hypothetical protein